jgi:hypothetical protein
VHCCDPQTGEGVERREGFDTAHNAHRSPRADPPSEQQLHSKESLRRAEDAVQRCGVAWGVSEPTIRVWGLGKRHASSVRFDPTHTRTCMNGTSAASCTVEGNTMNVTTAASELAAEMTPVAVVRSPSPNLQCTMC